MPNRLANETSPYLLQHADNPVDWFPWGSAAVEASQRDDKPIFLSIGYSACHWCHVMEHESFEDEAIAEQLNRDFVSIKVDREERPDLDNIYMMAVQMITGRGGWPMSVFLTPDLKPFFGGTYWPPTNRNGMPGFAQVLSAVHDAWQNRRADTIDQSEQLTQRIQELGIARCRDEFALAHAQLLDDSATQLERTFDFQHGGFGDAPKFPHPMNLQQLLRVWHRTRNDRLLDMVKLTLDKMAAGGIYDHLGGGFARYSVDSQWLVPHFEKMLYDNALLVNAYLDAFLASGIDHYATVAHDTIQYILRDMTDVGGAFHSTEDADSEGEEGRFYVWSKQEILDRLGDDVGERFCDVYDVTEGGNFEGRNILHRTKSLAQCAALKGWDETQLRKEVAAARDVLLEHRSHRVRPNKDDKILVSWNGLMIDAMARAGCIMDESDFVQAARRAAKFILANMRQDNGQLFHCYRSGQARLNAYLDDYACLANGLVTLYEATFEEHWIDSACELVEIMRSRFGDPNGYGFFFTADDHEELIARQKDIHDSSVPSGNAMAATVLTRLGKLCGRSDFVTEAREILDFSAEIIERSPAASGQLQIVLDLHTNPMHEIVVLGDPVEPETREVIGALWKSFILNRVIACRPRADAEGSTFIDPIFVGRQPLYGNPSVFVCQKFACDRPVSGKEAAIGKWSELAAGGTVLP